MKRYEAKILGDAGLQPGRSNDFVVLASDYDALNKSFLQSMEGSHSTEILLTERIATLTQRLQQESKAREGREALLQRCEALEAAIKPLSDIPLEDFGWGEHRPDQSITGWNKHTVYVRDVLAARLALAPDGGRS